MAKTTVANDALFELVNALDCVSMTLSEMTRVLEAQREAVSLNDLSRLLVVTGEQDELTAQLERCDRRRQRAQARIERHLEVVGLRAIIAALPDALQFRTRLTELADAIRPKTQALREHGRFPSQIQIASIEQAQQSRAYLLQEAGGEPAYAAPLFTL
jgi:flagellar biosynthesis/type III secretory pathway chaperone